MYRYFIVVLCFGMAACSAEILEEADAAQSNFSEEKVWIWAHFNVPSEGKDLDSYYYYGLVSKTLFEKIKSQEIKSGLIFLDNVRYWSSSQDKIVAYTDELDDNLLAFRIEHIARLIKLKKTPKIGFTYEDEDAEEVSLEENSEETKPEE